MSGASACYRCCRPLTSPSRTCALTLSLRPASRQFSGHLPASSHARQPLRVMAPKQATLGYVKARQGTIGCVEGGAVSPDM